MPPTGGCSARGWPAMRTSTRFGRSLIQAPGSAELLSDLAGEVRHGLGLTWAPDIAGCGGRAAAGGHGRHAGRRTQARPCPSNIGAPSWDASSAARVPTARCWPRTAGCWPISPPRPRWACTTSTSPRNSPGASSRSGTRRPNWRRPAIAWWRDRTPSAAGFSQPARRGPAGDRGAVGQGRAGAPATAAG